VRMSEKGNDNGEFDVVTVDLEDGRDYPIYIGADFDQSAAGEILRSHVGGKRVLIVTNDRVAPLYLERYESMFQEGGQLQVGTCVW
jgi:3-dehydroquinate synthase